MKLSDRMTGHRFSCEIFCSESEYSIRLENILSIIKHMILFLFCFYKKKSKNRIIRINTGILSNMKQKIKEFYH